MPDEQDHTPDASDQHDAQAGDPSEQADAAGDARRSAAEALAHEALQAAQKAVSDLDGADDADEKVAAAAALQAAQDAVAGLSGAGSGGAAPVNLPDLAHGAMREGAALPGGLDLLSDVNLNVKIELGRTRMYLEDVLRLGEGSVVELDKLAGDPVDVYVNERHVARGEVLILNDNFCVRINEIVNTPAPE
jgi:flagellar motor switch protein FliN/FliY